MIKYGSDHIEEMKFSSFYMTIERRDDQWLDITLKPELSSESAAIPVDLADLTIFVICNHAGAIAQMVPQDIGCDCEYQLTFSEKEQVKAYILSEAIQQQIGQAAAQL